MSISLYNSPSGTRNISVFNSPGGTQNSFMASSVSGAVLAYSYLYSTVNITPSSVVSDAGGNVYVIGSLTTPTVPVFPNSFRPVPAPYYSFFTTGVGGGYLIKYDRFGKIIGFMESTSAVAQIAIDAGSNVYLNITNNGGTFTVGDLDPTDPLGGVRQTGIQGPVIKYSPAGKFLASGGSNFVSATGLAVDAGSNVYIIGTNRYTARQNVFNIGNPSTASGFSLPPSTWPGSGALGNYGNYLLKYSPSGTYLGYSVITNTFGFAPTSTGGFLGVYPAVSGNVYVTGTIESNLYCNVSSISTSDPSSNLYSLNRTATPPTSATGSNAFVVQFGPSGAVNSFVEIGNSQAVSGARSISPAGLGFTSSGSFYVQSTYTTASSGTTTPLFNFGLADPKTGSFLSASGLSVPVVSSGQPGSPIMIKYNSSGIPQTVNLYNFAGSGKTVTIDKNDSVYQLFSTSTTLSSFTLVNLDNTTTSISVPAVAGTNYTLVKYDSTGKAIGFAPAINVNTNNGTLYSDNRGVYMSWRFTNIQSNVNAISTTVSPYATLPSITPATQGSAFVLWSL